MGFSSLIFLWCLPVFTGISAVLVAGGTIQRPILSRFCMQLANIFLIVCSLFFYWWGAGVEGLYFIGIVIAINYFAAICIQKLPSKRAAQLALVLICTAIIAYLTLFKGVAYLSRLYQRDILPTSFLSLSILLPLAISFLVFHAISYQVELYKSRFSADETSAAAKLGLHANGMPRFLDLCLYLCYFPKLIQGPIVQFQQFAPQIRQRNMSLMQFYAGFMRFVFGLAKKVLCADVLAHSMASIDLFSLSVPLAWFILLLFTVRLYIDFSAYSDMALGLAQMNGFSFNENFNYPYRSCSIQEFWQRWHISLGAFFKRYLYIPLGGSREGNVYIHLMAVFVVSGLWHEFGLVYLLWGLLHGLCSCVERYLNKRGIFQKIPKALRWAYCFFVVNIGWIVFMMGTEEKSLAFIQQMFGMLPYSHSQLQLENFINKQLVVILVISVLFGILAGNQKIQTWWQVRKDKGAFMLLQFAACILCLLLSYMMVVTSSFSPFLYFQY